MKNDPFATQKLDPEEQELSDALDKALEEGVLESVPNEKEEIEKLRASVRYTLAKNKSISLRLADSTLQRLKAIALEEGLPYQTYIGSILHKHVTNWEKKARQSR